MWMVDPRSHCIAILWGSRNSEVLFSAFALVIKGACIISGPTRKPDQIDWFWVICIGIYFSRFWKWIILTKLLKPAHTYISFFIAQFMIKVWRQRIDRALCSRFLISLSRFFSFYSRNHRKRIITLPTLGTSQELNCDWLLRSSS